MNIALLGYRGSGKTTIGRALAAVLDRPFIDTDDLVVADARKSIREIFQQNGERRFRDLEVRAVFRAFDVPDAVISLGGGAILRDETKHLLVNSDALRIFLSCEPVELHRRIEDDPRTAATRPRLSKVGSSLDEIVRLLEAREPLYRAAMTHELDVTNLPIDAAVAAIRQIVEKRVT